VSGVHTVASAIIGAQQTHARKAADFYPTPADATWVLLEWLDLPRGTTVKEPACGDGAMSRVLEAAGLRVDSSDLRPDCGFGRGGVDFLQSPGAAAQWIITNPPFHVAADFIDQALRLTPNVAMLLKSQFWHARSRIELFERHTPAAILPLTWRPAFLEAERGRSPLMDVMWVVWKQGEHRALYRPLRRPARGDVPKPNSSRTRTFDAEILDLLGPATFNHDLLELL
jgi:hypothetical protein